MYEFSPRSDEELGVLDMALEWRLTMESLKTP